jgi:hypothetical protein
LENITTVNRDFPFHLPKAFLNEDRWVEKCKFVKADQAIIRKGA